MDLTKISEGQFLCDGNRTDTGPSQLTVEIVAEAFASIDFDYKQARLLCDYGIYKVIGLDIRGDTALLDQSYNPVGFYTGNDIVLDASVQCKGLSVPLILFAVRDRVLPKSRAVSVAGERALRKAWRVANGEPSPWWPCPSSA